jgi:hypothetical protein
VIQMSRNASPDLARPLAYADRSLIDRRVRALRLAFGVTYVVGAGVHIGIVAADPGTYRPFADAALPPIRDAWTTVFMAAPAGWGLAVAAGEFVIGMLLLIGNRQAARAGVTAAIGFHVALLLFGWWAWFYAVPALGLLILAARLLLQDSTIHRTRSGPGRPGYRGR